MCSSTSATSRMKKALESSATNTDVSTYIDSFLKETMDIIITETNQQRLESDVYVRKAHYDIKIFLRIAGDEASEFSSSEGAVPLGWLTANDEEDWPKTEEIRLSKRRLVWEWVKERFRGKGPIRKFVRVFRRLRKKYKERKKLGIHGIEWKLAIQIIFLIAVIAVLVAALIAVFAFSGPGVTVGLPLAGLVIAFFTFLQDWHENFFKDYEGAQKDQPEWESENGDFVGMAKGEFQNINMIMERYTKENEGLGQLGITLKRMLECGKKVIEEMKRRIKNMAN